MKVIGWECRGGARQARIFSCRIDKVKKGEWDKLDNPLKNAPHTMEEIAGEWTHAYTREVAAYPLPGVRAHKYWAPVKRLDQV